LPDLAILQPTEFELVTSLKAAMALGMVYRKTWRGISLAGIS